MHPLLVINSLGAGGAERSTAEFLVYLVQNGVSPTVACLYHSSEGVESEVVDRGIDVRFMKGGGVVSKTKALRRVVAEIEPDLVHTVIFDADVVGRVAAVGGPPVLSSIVNVAYDPIRWQDPNVKRWRLSVVHNLDRLTARVLTSHFHAISQTVKRSAVSQLGIRSASVTVIERGRDERRLGQPSSERRSRMRRTLKVPDDAPLLICVGRQEFQKGHEYLLDAMRQVVDVHPGAILLLVGRRGHASPVLRSIVATGGLADSVRMLGHRDDVADLLAAADIFVFPSLYEGLGGAAIEAMALGLPIVASDLPALREFVEPDDNGVLVRSQSAEGLATAISELIGRPEYARDLGRRGRELFLNRFTAEREHNQMFELYKAVAARGRGKFVRA